jgi:hypothetical protein
MSHRVAPLPQAVRANLNNVRNSQDLEALFNVHRQEERRTARAPNGWDRVGAGLQGRDQRKYYPELSEGKRKEESGGCCTVM